MFYGRAQPTELKLAALDKTAPYYYSTARLYTRSNLLVSMQCLSHALIVHLELAAMYEGQIIC